MLANNTSYSNGQNTGITYSSGIGLDGTSSYNRILGNHCLNNLGWFIAPFTDNSQRIGILLSSTASYNQVYDNVCNENITNGIRDDGQYSNFVIGNQVMNNGQYGIRVNAAGVVGSKFFDNYFSGNATAAFLDSGTDTQVPELYGGYLSPLATMGDHPVIEMADNTTTNVYNRVYLPLEFQELVSAQIIVCQTTTAGPPNMRWQLDTDFGKICANENYNTHSDNIGATDSPLDQNQMECLDISAALTGMAAGDLIGFNFARLGAHANDTVNASVYYMGTRVRYV